MMQNDKSDQAPSPSIRFDLDAANFFQAEAVGVVLPILNTFLKEARWRYDEIGVATALLGLGTLLFQTPAGVLVDRIKSRRILFFIGSIAVGLCFGIIPFVPRTALWIDSLLFLSGVAQSIFAPVLGALALALVGYKALNRTLGEDQGWNHAGNIVAAPLAFVAVRYFARCLCHGAGNRRSRRPHRLRTRAAALRLQPDLHRLCALALLAAATFQLLVPGRQQYTPLTSREQPRQFPSDREP